MDTDILPQRPDLIYPEHLDMDNLSLRLLLRGLGNRYDKAAIQERQSILHILGERTIDRWRKEQIVIGVRLGTLTAEEALASW